MAKYRFARFELASRGDLVRTMVGAILLVGLGEPIISVLAHTIPRRDFHRLVRGWAVAATRFLDMRVDISGLEHIDPSQSYVLAPLHESFADALALAKLPLELRYVARDELFEWPQLGRFLRASEQIMVTPEQPRGEIRTMIDEIERAFARDESVVLFPQGTILGIEAAFTEGAFRIADMLGRPLLPVVITGTHRVWEHPYTDRLRFGQRVSLTVLPAIQTGRARASMRETERKMKRIAISSATAPPRRFDPRVDGFWDGYRYEIDPDFPEVATLIAQHHEAGSQKQTTG